MVSPRLPPPVIVTDPESCELGRPLFCKPQNRVLMGRSTHDHNARCGS